MSTNNYATFNDVELSKEIKRRKIFFGLYVTAVTIMAIASIVRAVRGNFDFMTFFPLIFLANSFVYWLKLKKLLEEGKTRGVK